MQVEKNKAVTIEYTLTDPEGQVLDSSKGRQPLTYLHGTGGLIPGLENALEGKNAGDVLVVSVPPDQAYGEKDQSLIQAVPRNLFSGTDQIEKGMRFQVQSPAGRQIVTVVDVDPQMVTIDANHPLAGMTLNFDVTVLSVRDASPEELAHGHIHGPDGHAH